MKRPLVGINVFVINRNCLLMGRRKGGSHDGSWSLPGGHLELMESFYGCAVRELKEETGIDAKELSLIQMINDPLVGSSHYVHVNFIAKVFSGQPKLEEPSKFYEWRWCPLDKLPQDIFVGHRTAICEFAKQGMADRIMGLAENKITFLDA